MTNRRMFSRDIVRSDAFLDLPISSQALYFHLGMEADDRGYVNNPKTVIRSVGVTVGDLEQLANKKFILIRENSLILIKHWKMNNLIKNDRFKETKYVDDLKKLFFDENNSYTETPTKMPCLKSTDTCWNQNGTDVEPQVSIGKVSIGKVRKEKEDIDISSKKKDNDKRFVKPTVEEIQAYCNERNNGIDAQKFYDFYESKGWFVGKNKMKDWKAAVRTWERSQYQSNKSDPLNTDRRYGNDEDYI